MGARGGGEGVLRALAGEERRLAGFRAGLGGSRGFAKRAF